MLRINNIEVRYANVVLVLRGITLEVEKGAIVSMLGGNGAGKTTTLKAIQGSFTLKRVKSRTEA
jgi:branched-chain amino acid transport system ATP-binding protein